MTTTVARPRNRAGSGAFYIGMGLIVAATVLNVAYDHLPRTGARMMPQFLAQMYDSSGKMGVTAIFVATGLSFILFGFALPRGREERRASNRSAGGPPDVPLLTPGDDEEANVAPNGGVILRTRKYLPPDAGLSGATGWAAPRRS